MKDNVEGDEMWIVVSQRMFLLIICKSNSIRVYGLSPEGGQRSFSYDLPSDKERMLMNSLCFNAFTFSETFYW